MSYLRWLCAMQYAKVARRGNAFVETVNAFRLHRQQKTLACEAAARARAEFWSRLSENFRRLRTGQPNFLRKPLPSRHLHQTERSVENLRNVDTATVYGLGNFRTRAKEIAAYIFRGRQKFPTPQKISSMSPLLESLRQTRESIGKLQLQKRSLGNPKQQLQPQQQLSTESASKIYVATSRKPLANFIMSRCCSWTESESANDLQENTQKTDEKATSPTNETTEDPTLPTPSSTRPQSECKTAIQNFISNERLYDTPHDSSEKQKAMLLPERPNILVLSEINNNGVAVNQSKASLNELFRQICKNAIQEKESQKSLKQLPVPIKTLNSSPCCKVSTVPAHCILPSQNRPVTLLVTNVLDKYKIISLPAGRAIPGQPKRHAQIDVKSGQNPTDLCHSSLLKRKV